jgi:hypothetical protein
VSGSVSATRHDGVAQSEDGLVIEGGIYRCGRHVVACGDLMAGHALALLGYANGGQLRLGDQPGTVDDGTPFEVPLLYTDPPWTPGHATMFRRWARPKHETDAVDFGALLSEVGRLARRVTRLYAVEVGRKAESAMRAALPTSTIGIELPYTQGVGVLLLGRRGDAEAGSEPLHRATARALLDSGAVSGNAPGCVMEAATEKGEWVMDPCLGLGTTLRDAQRTGRRCLGMEINPSRLRSACESIGELPTKIGEFA